MRALCLSLLLASCSIVEAAPVQHDILVLYTQKSATRWGAQLQPRIETAIALTNQVHADSGTGIVVRMVSLEPSPLQESGNFSTTLAQLVNNATVIARRNAIGADLVLLISEDTGCGGAGQLLWSFSNGVMVSMEAFAVATSSALPPAAALCNGDFAVPHEIGHMQNLNHNREDSGTAGTQAGYNFGYRVCGVVRDVMAYDCPTSHAPQVGRFSDPTATVNGVPFGIAYETDPLHAADAVRTLKESGPRIANFRTLKTQPNSPTNLMVN